HRQNHDPAGAGRQTDHVLSAAGSAAWAEFGGEGGMQRPSRSSAVTARLRGNGKAPLPRQRSAAKANSREKTTGGSHEPPYQTFLVARQQVRRGDFQHRV